MACRVLHRLSNSDSVQNSPEQSLAPRSFAQGMPDKLFADRIPTELFGSTVAIHHALLSFKTLLKGKTERVMCDEAGAFETNVDPRREGIRFAWQGLCCAWLDL